MRTITDNPDLGCRNETRRAKTRSAGYNGIDYLEVGADQLRLKLYFLGRAPQGLVPANVRILGGRRVRDVRVRDLQVGRSADPRFDDCLEVRVDKPGDFSTYRLCLVRTDDRGRPTDEPLEGFDPRYACIDFDFKAGCPSPLDCKPADVCPPAEPVEPEIDYLARDYPALREVILDRLALLVPDWRERHVPDLGITLVELLAYLGDRLSYTQDAVATEAYLDTARQRLSVRRHARLVDYVVHEGCNARAWVCLTTDTQIELDLAAICLLAADLPPGAGIMSAEELAELPRRSRRVFEPVVIETSSFVVRPAHNRLRFYTWGDEECCLAAGATTATLVDEWIDGEDGGDDGHDGDDDEEQDAGGYGTEEDESCDEPDDSTAPRPRRLALRPGDVLIFEEVIGPRTGNPADADPAHRHAVCITDVEPLVDPVCDQPVVEIRWAAEDALPFPLCLSARGPAPDCDLLEDVSVACGNVILVDHGHTRDEELGEVPLDTTEETCGDVCNPAEVILTAGRFRPRLERRPLTHGEPPRSYCPARDAVRQDPRGALARVVLHEAAAQTDVARAEEVPPTGHTWTVVRDLLGSRRQDRHFVVETDNRGDAYLRFGDGESGRAPAPGNCFRATYRVGNGPEGNVGAGAINRIVTKTKGSVQSGVELRVRNPLPAAGGTAAESIDEVKLLAPHAFRRVLARAVTADDYAAIVERDFEAVQQAAASLRFTGSHTEVVVAVDQVGVPAAEAALVERIERHLQRYRRIGHDIVVGPAVGVALDLEVVVCVLPEYLRGHVEAAVRAALSARVNRDGTRGLFHPDNLGFGDGIEVSRIVAAVQRLDGVESTHVARLERLFEDPRGEIERGFLALGPFEIARLDNDPSLPENGKLTLELRGGR